MSEPHRHPDIETRADCELLVRTFYGRALSDPIVGFLFTDVAHLDLDQHLPRIASYWETVLLGAQTYTGNPFERHAALNAKVPLRKGHFDRWVYLWQATVDELFEGERAEVAKALASRVAVAFRTRLRAGEQQPHSGGQQPQQPGIQTLLVLQRGTESD